MARILNLVIPITLILNTIVLTWLWSVSLDEAPVSVQLKLLTLLVLNFVSALSLFRRP